MGDGFEVHYYDGAGRLGTLPVPRADGVIETPALLPVVNPHLQIIPPSDLETRYGAQALITNGYIIHGSDELREPALANGLHDLLDFSGPIMTDSGSFQLSEYGSIEVSTEEILQFQHDIGSDIATPVDIPTPPDVSREQATEEVETTQERIELAAEMDLGDVLVTAPIQGSTHTDLRKSAAQQAYRVGLDIFPVGAVVPLMSDYRFSDLVRVVMTAKRGLGEDAPVHLFGAGHPMVFALAAAMGCDLFDSAAYALYARDGRYLTSSGTKQLDSLSTFPCECHVCSEHDPEGVTSAEEERRYELIARHNLAVSFAEIRRVRQAIRQGNLFELVERRASSHPAMRDGYRTLLEFADQLEATDPVSKGTFFYLSPESASRPEVIRHHNRLERLNVPESLLLTSGNPSDRFAESWRLIPPFGPVPREFLDVYPFTVEIPREVDSAAYEMAVEGISRLVEANPTVEFTVFHDGWPERSLEQIPDRVSIDVLGV